MTEKKEPIATCMARSARLTAAEDGPAVALTLEAEGKHAARAFSRMLDEAVILTEDGAAGKGAPTGHGKLSRLTLSTGGRDGEGPVKIRAVVSGHGNLQHLVGLRLLAEKAQRELLEEKEPEPDRKSKAAGE